MDIRCPYFTQKNLEDAVDVFRLCYAHGDSHGFTKPFLSPGGQYGSDWWSLDASLACDGYMYIDHRADADLLRNLSGAQKANGRIPLWGPDDISFHNIFEESASLPKYFETLYNAFLRGRDREKIYHLFKENLLWYKNARFDEKSGLYSALFEETFPPYHGLSREYAPVDLNAQILIGMENAESMAPEQEKEYWKTEKARLLEAIRTRLWNEKIGAYTALYLKTGEFDTRLTPGAFLPLRFGESEERKARLLLLLQDDSLFGWEHMPLTSLAKTDKNFTVTHGKYQGNPSWSGCVWTLWNAAVIHALLKAGCADQARHLLLATLREFASVNTEFIDPFTGSGEGVQQYAWSAGSCLQLVIEDLFGIRIENGTICARPLVREEMFILGLPLPDGGMADIYCRDGKARIDLHDSEFVIIYA